MGEFLKVFVILLTHNYQLIMNDNTKIIDKFFKLFENLNQIKPEYKTDQLIIPYNFHYHISKLESNPLLFSLLTNSFITFLLSEEEDIQLHLSIITQFFEKDIIFEELKIDVSIHNLIEKIMSEKNSNPCFKIINNLNTDELNDEDYIQEVKDILPLFCTSIYFTNLFIDRDILAFTTYKKHVFINQTYKYSFLRLEKQKLLFSKNELNRECAILLAILLHELGHWKRMYRSNSDNCLEFTPIELKYPSSQISSVRKKKLNKKSILQKKWKENLDQEKQKTKMKAKRISKKRSEMTKTKVLKPILKTGPRDEQLKRNEDDANFESCWMEIQKN